jgi:hypothetical protein
MKLHDQALRKQADERRRTERKQRHLQDDLRYALKKLPDPLDISLSYEAAVPIIEHLPEYKALDDEGRRAAFAKFVKRQKARTFHILGIMFSKHSINRSGFASIQKMVGLPQVADVGSPFASLIEIKNGNVNGIGIVSVSGNVNGIGTVTENATGIENVICTEDAKNMRGIVEVPDIIVMTMRVMAIVEITDEKEKGRRTKKTKNGTTDNPDIIVKKNVKALDPTLGMEEENGKTHLIARRALPSGRDMRKSYLRIRISEDKERNLLKRVKYRGCFLWSLHLNHIRILSIAKIV